MRVVASSLAARTKRLYKSPPSSTEKKRPYGLITITDGVACMIIIIVVENSLCFRCNYLKRHDFEWSVDKSKGDVAKTAIKLYT